MQNKPIQNRLATGRGNRTLFEVRGRPSRGFPKANLHGKTRSISSEKGFRSRSLAPLLNSLVGWSTPNNYFNCDPWVEQGHGIPSYGAAFPLQRRVRLKARRSTPARSIDPIANHEGRNNGQEYAKEKATRWRQTPRTRLRRQATVEGKIRKKKIEKKSKKKIEEKIKEKIKEKKNQRKKNEKKAKNKIFFEWPPTSHS